MDHRVIVRWLAVGMTILAAGGWVVAETRPPVGGRIALPLPEQPVAPGDPQAATRWSDQVLALAPADGLYRDGQPSLADGDPVFPAPLTARVRLRPALTHDGAHLQATEVAAALERARRAFPQIMGSIRSITAPAPDVVEIALARPASAADLIAVLGLPQAGVPRTGPFMMAAGRAPLRLEAFARHFHGRPFLDAITLESFPSAQAEATAFEVGRIQAVLRPGATPGALDGAQAILTFIGFAQSAPDALRRAMPLVVDRDAVRRFAARGPSMVVNGPPANLARARALLGSSGQAGFALLVDRSRVEDDHAAQKVQAQLARVGVAVRIEAVAPDEFERRVASRRGFDGFIGSCAPPAADAALAAAWIERCGATDLPLYRRGVRLHRAAALRGLRFDDAGRLRLDDAFLWRRGA